MKNQSQQIITARADWTSAHDWCFVCWCRGERFHRGLTLHHIMGRGRRHDVPENWMRLCQRDHQHLHDGGGAGRDGRLPELTRGMMLWCKRESDPDHYDEALLASLRRWRALPFGPERLPELFLMERLRQPRRLIHV